MELRDMGEYGGGRLLLIVRARQEGVVAEWYVAWSRAGRRHTLKIGVYPRMSLADGRQTFRSDYQPAILKGEDPTGPRAKAASGGATVWRLFECYVAHLGSRPAAEANRQVLFGRSGVAHVVGRQKLASAARPEDFVPILARIHEGGSANYTNRVRAILHAAFGYGVRMKHSFFDPAGAVDWGLTKNPITIIPKVPDANRISLRFLDQGEFRAFWRWLERSPGERRTMDAIRLIMATGQRVCEILRLRVEYYDMANRLIEWPKTKNRMPHSIPLSPQAIAILDGLEPNEHGLYFWHRDSPDKEAPDNVCRRIVRRYLTETEAKSFIMKDMRRTWKTLSGQAGLSKEMRDRLQNHARSDVSSRHYDRWDAMPQKREAIAVWSAFLQDTLDGVPGEQSNISVDLPPSVSIDRLCKLFVAMGSNSWRAAPQAHHREDWVGRAIAHAYGITVKADDRKKIARFQANLQSAGIIEQITQWDPDRRGPNPRFVFSRQLLGVVAAYRERAGLPQLPAPKSSQILVSAVEHLKAKPKKRMGRPPAPPPVNQPDLFS